MRLFKYGLRAALLSLPMLAGLAHADTSASDQCAATNEKSEIRYESPSYPDEGTVLSLPMFLDVVEQEMEDNKYFLSSEVPKANKYCLSFELPTQPLEACNTNLAIAAMFPFYLTIVTDQGKDGSYDKHCVFRVTSEDEAELIGL